MIDGVTSPHARVANQRQIAAQFGGIVAHEIEQVLGAAFLLALDQHGDVERNRASNRLKGAARLDKGHRLAFVVAGTTRHDDFAAAVERFDARLERRRLPQIEWIDRLHIIVSVKQNARRATVACGLADHDRMAVGRADARLKAEAAQIGRHMLGGCTAVRCVSRVGRYRLDAQ